MNNVQIDYYSILGVSEKATLEEIKKHYRELARRYHPDVNPSADAAQRIKSINEAYHVLGDEDRRTTYDAERLLRAEAQRAAQAARTEHASAHTAKETHRSSGAAPRNGERRAPYDFNGFGRVRPDIGYASTGPRRAEAAPKSAQKAAPRKPPRPEQENIGITVQSLVADAQMAYVMRRYHDAERLCKQVLALDRRQPIIHEMLGDIYSRRGDRERASTAYAYAVQFNPRNQSAQIKLERLAGADMQHRAAPTMTRAVQTPLIERILNGPNRDRFIGGTSVVLGAALAAVLFGFANYPGYGTLVLGALSFNLLLTLLITGLICGVLLAFYGGMRPVTQELALRSNNRSPVNLSTVLTFSAIVWFYASLLIYIFVAVTRNRPSFSVLRAYGATLLLSVVFAVLYQRPAVPLAGVETAAFAGNLLFPTLLLGWRLGDRLRLSGL
jgi:tetratricopeptide (TPR) repeat protein